MGQGNGTFRDSLTFSRVIEARPGRTVYGLRKRGGRSPVVFPMSTTGNGKEYVYSLGLHEHGQSRVSVFQERPQLGGKRQVKSRGRL